jgi:hypothetical protein
MILDYIDFLDSEYLIDVSLLRREFAAVDVMDTGSLRAWFAAHPYLTVNDNCRIARVSLKTVQRWRNATGHPRVRRRWPPGWRRPGPALESPPDWRAGNWLQDQYAAGHGVRTIARAARRSYAAIRRLLLRRGVVFRTAREAVRSRHSCCNRTWLLRHYVVAGLSLTACARRAGVSRYTLTAWLHQHEIRVRSVAEQLMLRHAGRSMTPAPTPIPGNAAS